MPTPCDLLTLGRRVSFGLLLVPVVSLGLPTPRLLQAQATDATPQQAPASRSPSNRPSASSPAMQRLGGMFSPQIQSIVNACWERGKVNLSPQAAPDTPVICGDGRPEAQITHRTYVETVSDILTASSLVGFRAVMQSDPRLTPEMLRMFISNSEGMTVLRNTIQTAITQSQLVSSPNSPSTAVLTEAVVSRLVPVLRDPNGVTGLLGTPQQYDRVVRSFCNPPGTTIEQARTQIPELSSLQLYAICIQESGVTQEVVPESGRPRR